MTVKKEKIAVVTVLIAISFAGIGIWVRHTDSAIDLLSAEMKDHNSSIVVLETAYPFLTRELDRMNEQIREMNDKLDELLGITRRSETRQKKESRLKPWKPYTGGQVIMPKRGMEGE